MKKQIKIASVKGHFINYLNQYLQSIGINEKIDKKSKKLSHVFNYKDNYEIKIVLLRWQDIKTLAKDFDLVLFGSDQWLENGHKSMVILDKFEQDNCSICLMHQKKDFDVNKNIATSFPNISTSYMGISGENIKYMSGSVEAAAALGIADQIIDIVDTGASAAANGFIYKQEIMKIHAVLGTTNLNKIEFLKNIGIIQHKTPDSKALRVAFEGNEGAGKSTLAKHFTMNSLNGKPSVLVTPYSGFIGQQANELLKNEKYLEWATHVGFNHWKPDDNINAVYDRNILTCLTELIERCDEDTIIKTINKWGNLPDVIFYCDAGFELQYQRCHSRTVQDKYDDYHSLKRYHELYDKACDFAKVVLGIHVVTVDTSQSLENNISFIKKVIEEQSI